jgi:hypothetical protein
LLLPTRSSADLLNVSVYISFQIGKEVGQAMIARIVYTYITRRAPNNRSLLSEPTPRGLALALQDDSVALQTRCHVIPRRSDEFIFAAKIFEFLLEFGLLFVSELSPAKKGSTNRAFLCRLLLHFLEFLAKGIIGFVLLIQVLK